jgi:hypothetical protein
VTDVVDFRQYAKEALRAATETRNKNEVEALVELACTWARAAAAGERALFRPRLRLVKPRADSFFTQRPASPSVANVSMSIRSDLPAGSVTVT